MSRKDIGIATADHIDLGDCRLLFKDSSGMTPAISESVRRTSVWAGRRNEKVGACAKAQTFGSQVKSPQQRLFTQAPHPQPSISPPSLRFIHRFGRLISLSFHLSYFDDLRFLTKRTTRLFRFVPDCMLLCGRPET
jgi:hypothetical protein